MLGFIGVPFDPGCLGFHENRHYAGTASYAQVAEKRYDRSVSRHRHDLRHLAPVTPIPRPAIARLGSRSIRNLYAVRSAATSLLYASLYIWSPERHGAAIPVPGTPMIDLLYILIGAAFLGGCVLYAIACDHL
ncbi:MAG: hypothetical protein HIU82_03090 [Proteobacteria bacterium]|nr:hypothetical protein [Pseudomonadota bacterium]